MENKTVLITGSTSGIGKETARALAQQGYFVIIHGRNKEKTEAVCNELKAETGNNNIDFLIADLLLLSAVKQMADEFKKKFKRLDVLINNAGAIFNKKREITAEGFEKTFALNILAPFLLTHLLLDILANSSDARIINIASVSYKFAYKPDFKDFQSEKRYLYINNYAISKLYLIWITQHLSIILKNNGLEHITANSSEPGIVASSFGQNSDKGFFSNLVFKMFLRRPFFISSKKAALTTVYLATSEDVKNITGQFFNHKMKIVKPCEKYYSEENEKTVWDYCMDKIKKYL